MKNKFGQSYFDDTVGLAKELRGDADRDAKLYAFKLLAERFLILLAILLVIAGVMLFV